jgi:uncharacterized iron-regulated protein
MNCRSAVSGRTAVLLLSVLAGGCGSLPDASADLRGLLPTPLLLVGELHDAPEHQALQRDTVRQLADRGELAAVVLEMVEQGRATTGLPTDASEARVREALDWSADRNAGAWPWTVYGPVVMTAVRAGAPVLGGNLPRAQMRASMGEASLDASLPPLALAQQREAIREGHCNLLPDAQIAPMTRIQLARDRAMAQTAVSAQRAGRTVLLIAGNGHVQRDLGVPRHLPSDQAHRVVMALARDAAAPTLEASAQADRIWVTPPRPPKNHCADMKRQMGR